MLASVRGVLYHTRDSFMARIPVLIIHSGAGRQVADAGRARALEKKLKRILDPAYARLAESGALDAVTLAVRLLEDDSGFNAGRGAYLQADGKARLSASVMDGSRGRFAAVINLEQIQNPVLAARALLDDKDRVLAGEGAGLFARKLGLKRLKSISRRSRLLWRKWSKSGCDTVGACALDRWGRLASASSTGGRGFERPGRVSDSGMPVASYADRHAAVAATGIGEEIMDSGLAVRIVTRVADGLSLARAFAKTFREARTRGLRLGGIGVDWRGNLAWETPTPALFFAWKRGGRGGLWT